MSDVPHDQDDANTYRVKARIPKWDDPYIAREAEVIIARTYLRHHALGDHSDRFPVRPSIGELETLGKALPSYKPRNWSDRMAAVLVRMLRPLTHAFFRERYMSHAVCLETVAACPGIVAAGARHFHSLRHMKRDHGWLHVCWEEAENERMHLLIWMSVIKPTRIERALVIAAQFFYVSAYAVMYALIPKMAHRFVGYLEEEAVSAYTLLLESIDQGKTPNGPAPDIARRYYRLPKDATVRDVVLHVRADECMHALVNHRASELLHSHGRSVELDVPPVFPEIELLPHDHPKRVAARHQMKRKDVDGVE